MNIAVVDDEKEVRYYLKKQIMEQKADHSIYLYAAGEEFLSSEENFDIVFLDIQMKGIDGIETARVLRKQHKDMILIFITGRKEYVFQAFDVEAFHYLVKPFDDDKFASVLQTAVNRRLEKSVNAAASLVITRGGEHITVNPQEIMYAEVFDRKIILHTLQDEIEYYGKMKELEKKVGEDFYRPHRAYLVNMNYIRKYDATAIYLSKGQALMAKQNYQDFVKCYLRYIRRKGTEEDVQ